MPRKTIIMLCNITEINVIVINMHVIHGAAFVDHPFSIMCRAITKGRSR